MSEGQVTEDEIKEQVERCRRLASAITDDEARHSLEDLARAYEEQLAEQPRPFMLIGNAAETKKGGR